MITSQPTLGDQRLVGLQTEGIAGGVLRTTSYFRPTYVWSVESIRIRRKAGELSASLTQTALETLRSVLDE
jgi:hypothetical protein